MKIRISLIGILFRQALLVELIALPIIGLYMLFTREPISWQNPWIAIFILSHSIAVAVCLGRFRSADFAFLYTRGYSRDQLWVHKMLATVLCVLAMWLPIALIVWTPVRSIVQDKMFNSPYFPIMAQREAAVPWFWLAGYAILLPMFHYVWIRQAQPIKGSNGAVLLAIGMVIVIVTLMTFRWHQDWFKILILVLSTITIITSLIAGLLLHRKLEVQK
ncbi:MAG: hypothetical protein ACYTBP_06470 [Planctomycetota bacterium]|jgi:hypothetical protein